MPAPFAALESRVNSAVIARLSNAMATIGGVDIAVIFDNGYAAFDMISGSKPAIKALASDVAAVSEGTALKVNAVDYTVSEIHPDGTGLTVLLLDAV